MRAVFSSGAARNSSPASGTAARPSTCTGVEGPATFTCSPLSLIIARTRPQAAPATIGSPTFSSPLSTSTVATGPRPTSSLASSTTPLARPVGLAFSSSSSATTSSWSRRSSIPSSWVADISTTIVSPPHDSGTNSCSASWVSTRCGSALSLSILLTATMIGTTGAHLRERGVARRVEERDLLAVLLDLVCTDVLGDATGLTGHHVGVADLVQHGRLAVIDVAHDRDDRRPRLLVLLVVAVVEQRLEADLLLLTGLDEHDVGADLEGEQ